MLPVPPDLPAAAPGSPASAPEPPAAPAPTAAPGKRPAEPGERGAAVRPDQPLPRGGYPIGVRAHSGGTGRVLLTFPGGYVQLDYPVGTMGRAELALPALRDAVRLVPRWRLDRYVGRITEGRERHL